MRRFLLCLLLIPAVCRADDAKDKPPAKAEPAADVLAAALAKAKSDGKAVFLAFGSPSCGWCKVLDRYHARPAVAAITGRHLVMAKVDIEENPGGDKMYAKYSPPGVQGVPTWVILSADGAVLADSFEEVKGGEKKNVGFPAAPNELAHYEKVMRTALPKLSADDLATLMAELRDAAPKTK
jgi:Protein of unknown function, DUF255